MKITYSRATIMEPPSFDCRVSRSALWEADVDEEFNEASESLNLRCTHHKCVGDFSGFFDEVEKTFTASKSNAHMLFDFFRKSYLISSSLISKEHMAMAPQTLTLSLKLDWP